MPCVCSESSDHYLQFANESRPSRQACYKLCPNVWCVPKECAYQPNYPGGRMSTIHNKNYTIHKMCYMDAIQDTVHAQNYTIHKLYYMNPSRYT